MQPVFRKLEEVVKLPHESPQSAPPVSNTRAVPRTSNHSPYLPQNRGPITHPHYKLGDLARDEDMLVFPKSSKRSRRRYSRSRRRRKENRSGRGADGDGTSSNEDDSSSCSEDSDDEEEYCRCSRKSSIRIAIYIMLAIGQLRHLDAAFVSLLNCNRFLAAS